MDVLTVEESQQTPKKKRSRIFTIYSVLCILSIVNCIIYVSSISVSLCFTFCIYWILFHIYRESWLTRGSFIALGIFNVVFCFFINVYTNTNVIYRHPWQYERAMNQLSKNSISHFPETIPDCATNVSFRMRYPANWSGQNFITLSFIADDVYIQECKEKHLLTYFDYNGYNVEDAPDDAINEWKKWYWIDLYPFFEKQYNNSYIPLYIENEIEYILSGRICLTEEELRSARQYYILSNHGFIIVEDTNRIIFYSRF